MKPDMPAAPPGSLEPLLAAARAARAHAYAPYSGFAVGAALATAGGSIHAGCNVENAAYPAGTCAEEAAIAAMVAAGERRILAIVIVAERPSLVTPCGACRQRLREFGTPDLAVHAADAGGLRRSFRLDELLPHAFGPDHLQR